jgi:hypothetical protein
MLIFIALAGAHLSRVPYLHLKGIFDHARCAQTILILSFTFTTDKKGKAFSA